MATGTTGATGDKESLSHIKIMNAYFLVYKQISVISILVLVLEFCRSSANGAAYTDFSSLSTLSRC